MKLQGLWVAFYLLLTLPAQAAMEAAVNAELLLYRITEPGSEAYISRILVTPKSIRIDQGGDDQGYLLYEREAGAIYSVVPEDHSILEIRPSPKKAVPPQDLQPGVREKTDPAAPRIAGIKPIELMLLANGKVCKQVIVVPGLMVEATAALKQYFQTLAYQHAATQASTPSR